MTWTAKWRKVLVLWLGFAVSPLSMCAQTVCDITCSFPASPRHSARPEEAFRGSPKGSAGTHCHELAGSGDEHPATFPNPKAACHQDNCITREIRMAPTVAQGKLRAAPLDRIAPPGAVRFATPPVTERHRPPNPSVKFTAVLAVSEILRI
jgi:hypothetical protein